MAAIKLNREWFSPKGEDGNLSLATRESRIREAIASLNPGDWIELDERTKCTTIEELKKVLMINPSHADNLVKAIVCPNCGANTKNYHNCEYCGSLLVRYTAENKVVDEMTFGKDVPEIAGLKDELKKNLSFQRIKKSDDAVVTTITDRDGCVYQVLNTMDCHLGTDTGNPFENSGEEGIAFRVTFEIRDNNIDFAEQEKARLRWFKQQNFFFLFTPQNHSKGIYYYIDFGQDVDNAAKLISKIISVDTDTSDIFGIETRMVTKKDLENVSGVIVNSGQEKRTRIGWIVGVIVLIIVIIIKSVL